jgi:creatinine amidohydrolase
MPKNHLGYMTWPEVKQAAERKLPVLIPMGTVEVQGLHTPMGFDYIVAERLAWAVAEREESIVCPTIPYGYSDFSNSFPGTVTLNPQTVYELVRDVTASLLGHGFRHLIFLDRHTLSDPMRRQVAEEFRESHGVKIASVFPTSLTPSVSKDLYEKQEGVFAHGGEPGASLMLYLTPDDMRMEGAERHPPQSPWNGLEVVGPNSVRIGKSDLTVYINFADVAPTGGLGDPSLADAERGKIMFDRMVDVIAEFVARFRKIEM